VTTVIGTSYAEPIFDESDGPDAGSTGAHESSTATSRIRSNLSSFGVSFAVHAVAFIALACIVQKTIVESELKLTAAAIPIETAPEEYKFDVTVVDTIGNGGTAKGGPAMGGTSSTTVGSLAAVGKGGGILKRHVEKKIDATVIDAPSSSAVAVFEPTTPTFSPPWKLRARPNMPAASPERSTG
jgi:hypothetical protein